MSENESDFRRYLPGSDYRSDIPPMPRSDPHDWSAGPQEAAADDYAASSHASNDERTATPYESTAPVAASAHPVVAPLATARPAPAPAEPAKVPPPTSIRPRRSRKARSFLVSVLNLVITLFVIGALAAAGVGYLGYTQFQKAGPLTEPTSIVVQRGDSFDSITPELVERGVIARQPVNVFALGARVTGKASQLQTGEFEFEPGMSMEAVVAHLTEGQPLKRRFVVPEGFTVWKVWERLVALRNEGLLVGELGEMPPEGTLWPATYPYTRGTKAKSIVDWMRREHDRRVAEVWKSRDPDLPISSPDELVTLASIVERETGMDGERGKVAAVFVNRLRKRMRLDSDPTTIYGIWGGQGKPDGYGGLRQSDLDKRNAYNTRRVRGLPPGPIANPGMEALRAVANPPETDALYFVADGTGGHVFARTLREHNRNVREWRRIERGD